MVKKQQKTAAPLPAQGRRKDAGSASPDSAKAVKAARSEAAKAVKASRAKAAEAADTPFAEQVKTSAQQIWSAGLAAFAKAQDQGTTTVGKAEATIDATARRMSDLAGEVGSRAGQHWDKLESIFEDRVARALARLGMPSADDVAQLKGRIEALSAEVAMLRAAQAGVAPKPVAKASPKRPATKAAKATNATKGGKRTT